jgi:ethanolamine utilization protein EutN
MIIAKVVGTVIATRKDPKLIGNKFLILEPLETSKDRFVAIDNIGAGIGEIVLVTCGSSARICCNDKDVPVDAAVVGIIDDLKNIVSS